MLNTTFAWAAELSPMRMPSCEDEAPVMETSSMVLFGASRQIAAWELPLEQAAPGIVMLHVNPWIPRVWGGTGFPGELLYALSSPAMILTQVPLPE
jgi:hypothetical protein